MRSSNRRASACRSHGALGQSGCVSRRSLLRGALLGGAAVVAPAAGAGLGVPVAGDRLRAAPLPQGASRTLTLVTNRAPSDLDPHSAYDAGSGVLLQGPFEGLIRAKANTTDEFVPVLAESWEASADESVWTFRLRDGVTFQDGTPLDAHAARASFERLLTLGLAPSTVLGRFLTDPAQSHRSRPTHTRLRPGATAAAVRDGAGLRLRHRDRQHGRVAGPRSRWRLGACVGADQQ